MLSKSPTGGDEILTTLGRHGLASHHTDRPRCVVEFVPRADICVHNVGHGIVVIPIRPHNSRNTFSTQGHNSRNIISTVTTVYQHSHTRPHNRNGNNEHDECVWYHAHRHRHRERGWVVVVVATIRTTFKNDLMDRT